jgi:acetyl-CoA carboxylase biotin carboxyl carrier protein
LSHKNLSYDDLLRIVELIKTSEQFSEFRLKVGEIEIELRRRSASETPKAAAVAGPLPHESWSPAAPFPVGHTTGPATEPAPPRETPTWPEGSTVIRAPMVGTFYRAPTPGAPPFVEMGQHVQAETIVCIIEVMKLTNSIPAGASGTVMHVLVADAAPVEAGQPLIVLQPEAGPQ